MEAAVLPRNCGFGQAFVYAELLVAPAAKPENGFDRFLEGGVR
nr:hypothetical protein [Streptomyces sp. DSM 41633]